MRFDDLRLIRLSVAAGLLGGLLFAPDGGVASDCPSLLDRFNAAVASGDFARVLNEAQPILDGGCQPDTRTDVVEVVSAAAVMSVRGRNLPPDQEIAFLEQVREQTGAGIYLLERLAELEELRLQAASRERDGVLKSMRLAGQELDDPVLREAARRSAIASTLAATAMADPTRSRAVPRPSQEQIDRARARAYLANDIGVKVGGSYRCGDPRERCDATALAASGGLRFESVLPRPLPIRFATNRHELNAEAQLAVRQVAELLAQEAGMVARLQLLSAPGSVSDHAVPAEVMRPRICIVGHTDETGTDAINRPLSERRAASVRDHLIQLGYPAERIVATFGVGSSEPLALPPGSQFGRETILAMNRRVEIRIHDPRTNRCEPFRLH